MKKILFFLIFVLICVPLSVAVFAADEGDFRTGDADLSGNVNVRDATYIQKHVAGLIVMGEKSANLADVDANGVVNIKDATLIQKFLAGIVAEFPEKEGTTAIVTDAPSTAAPTTEVSKPEITTQAPTQVMPSGTLPATEPTVIPTQSPTKTPVDSDGYFDTVIRP